MDSLAIVVVVSQQPNQVLKHLHIQKLHPIRYKTLFNRQRGDHGRLPLKFLHLTLLAQCQLVMIGSHRLVYIPQRWQSQ